MSESIKVVEETLDWLRGLDKMRQCEKCEYIPRSDTIDIIHCEYCDRRLCDDCIEACVMERTETEHPCHYDENTGGIKFPL